MKIYFTYLYMKRFFAISGIALLLTSCGTSRDSAYQQSDGIYGTSTADRQVVETDQELENRNYYRQYFQTKAQVYANEPEGDIIFTDVEGYTSVNAYIDEDGIIHEEEIHYTESYGPWGETSEVTINIYNNPGWAYYGYWHRPLWWYRSGWGISYWHSWGGFYGPGWGWGGYYGPAWGWGYPYYWGGWGYYAHPGFYYSPYHGGYSNYVAYNRGRRNTDYRPNRAVGRDNTARTNRANQGRYSRTEVERRINNSRNAQNRTIRDVPSRQDQTRPAQRGERQIQRGERRDDNLNTQRNNRNQSPNTTRPNTNVRNSGNINRGGSTNMRSSGGSGMRGGGAVRSGGGRGGRG